MDDSTAIWCFQIIGCGRGIECLRSYQAEWDENLRTALPNMIGPHTPPTHGAISPWRGKSRVPPDEELDPIAELLRLPDME